MTKALLAAIALLCGNIAFAQSPIRVEFHAKWKQTNENKIIVDDDHMLIISGEQSKFYSIRQERFEQFADSMERTNPNIGLMGVRAKRGCPEEGVLYIIFKNHPKTGVLTYIEKKGNLDYLYEETIPSPEWQLVDGDTTILSYPCQKAVSHFRGRVWTAWYAPELPYDNGPWKLGGLPGLILKAEEQDGIFSFTATGIEKTEATDLKPADLHYARCTRKEFMALLDEYYGNRYRFAMKQLGFTDDDGEIPGLAHESPCLLDPED
ncbi:MAG: GLPGLI family protein [Marinilabiliaceae bacterium]